MVSGCPKEGLHMAKKARKVRGGKDVATNSKLPKRNASSVAKGAAYAVLAGRPSKQAVIAVFGKSGYALSWVARANRLGITPEELCERFKADSNRVEKLWAELAAENEKSDAK
jgi:hypothetical protein